MKYSIVVLFVLLTFFSCKEDGKRTQPKNKQPKTVQSTVKRPAFDADKAYEYVQKQVDFGYRVPGTKEHKACSDYLKDELSKFATTVQVQETTTKMYNGKTIPVYNIIGQFNPENPDRVLLAAHWDTRHIADKDDEKQDQPILGANDGASGVGVLLEIARQLKEQHSQKGIDIIFFDAEDLGDPTGKTENSWCLGSQYWSKNPHTPDYKAKYGILLDMVGSQNAVFKFEPYAYQAAASIYNQTWNNGIQLGYDYLFIKEYGGGVVDDHIYVMQNRKFPMIDIIDMDPNRGKDIFGHYHHTHDDNMSNIDKNTLKAVGETVLLTISQ